MGVNPRPCRRARDASAARAMPDRTPARRRARETKKTVAESEETLATKKTLLLSLLKDLEKQYRAQSISDETYNKIKDEYKQQAVDAMKKLDDLKK